MNKPDKLSEERKLIFFPSELKYLNYVLEYLSYVTNCSVKYLTENDLSNFLLFLRNESPTMIFVNLSKVNQLLNSQEWNEIQKLILENRIAICGIGNLLTFKNQDQLKSIANKIFNEPLRIDELVQFAIFKLRGGEDRRSGDRRKGVDRRMQHLSVVGSSQFVNSSLNGKNNTHLPSKALNQENKEEIYKMQIQVDHKGKRIFINGNAFETTPKEFKLIEYLLRNKGKVIATDDILKTVWPENSRATKADVHQYMYMLRNKLEEDPQNPKFLVTVKGFGYKLGK